MSPKAKTYTYFRRLTLICIICLYHLSFLNQLTEFYETGYKHRAITCHFTSVHVHFLSPKIRTNMAAVRACEMEVILASRDVAFLNFFRVVKHLRKNMQFLT